MNHQLALAIQLNDEATFNDFCWEGHQLLQKELLKALDGTGERFIYLWGNTGSGKSHLLQACCQHLGIDATSIYLPLETLKTWDASVLSDLEDHSLYCIDEIEAIAENTMWEEALFHLYNRVRDKSTLIVAANTPPKQLPIALPDLKSRLSSGLVIQIHELTDANKAKTLQSEALRRGFELSQQVAQFLVSRSARNMHDLRALLDKLDHASLEAQRKITIPFVKTTLNW